MADLVVFLRARLDERESKAKAATQGQFGKWMVDEGKHYQDGRARQIVTMAYDPEYALVDESAWPGEVVLTNCSYDHLIEEQEEADLHFIADNDPVFVLADVESKRQLLDGHEPERGVVGYTEDTVEPIYGMVCAACHSDEITVRWPCRHVRLLAQPYAGHPEFREEWTA